MTNPFGMSDDAFLDCLGPDWSQMTKAQRAAYPHPWTDEPEAPIPPPSPFARPLNARQLAAQARRGAL